MNPFKGVTAKNLNQPDETRPFKDHGHLDVVTLESGTVMAKAIFEPGWKWSQDVKPIAGTDSCQAAHTGVCLRGKMVIRMDDGQELHVKAGDAFQISPGHDAWVEGNEACEVLDFTGFENYARPSSETKAA